MDRSDPTRPERPQAVPGIEALRVYPGSDVDPVGDREHLKTRRRQRCISS
jgi:hypothetical protein